MGKHKYNSEHKSDLGSHIFGAFDGIVDIDNFEDDFEDFFEVSNDDTEYPGEYTRTSQYKTQRARDARKLDELYREDMELRDRLDEYYHHTDE